MRFARVQCAAANLALKRLKDSGTDAKVSVSLLALSTGL